MAPQSRREAVDVDREVLEELPTLWDPENPALQMIKTVDARP